MAVFYTSPQPSCEPIHLRNVGNRTFLTADWTRVSAPEALEAVQKAHPEARLSGHFVEIHSNEGDFLALEVFLGCVRK